MAIYFAITFIILSVGLITKPSKEKIGRIRFLVFSFLALAFVSGFRAVSIGVDTITYVSLFNSIDSIGAYYSRFEIGFLFLLKGLHAISSSETFFLLVTSCISIGIPIIIVYKYSEDPLLSVILYILLKDYFYQMNVIRQSLAVVIVLAAFAILINNKKRKTKVISFALILLGVSIHKVSIIAFIPYVFFVSPKKRDKYLKPETTVRYTLITSAIAFIAFPLIILISSHLFPQYMVYFYSEWGESNYFASLITMLMYLMFLLVGANYMRKKSVITDTDRLALMMTMFCVVTWTLAMRMEIFSRLAGLFSIYMPLLFVPSFTNCPILYTNRRILKIAIVLLCALYMTITFVFRPEWEGVVPYKFMF